MIEKNVITQLLVGDIEIQHKNGARVATIVHRNSGMSVMNKTLLSTLSVELYKLAESMPTEASGDSI